MNLPRYACLVALIACLPNVHAQQVSAAAHGMTATERGVTLEVTALREDVLRVRMWRDGKKPEDASWAVLPAARTSTVDVAATTGGFHTQKLRVTVGAELKLTVSDLDGTVLQEDAEPVAWRGDATFRVYKKRAMDEHFFGLGDKPGPLDRGGQAFTMWNTDNFGWQESTDPIYKSIPFFIDFRQGRSIGVMFDNTWRSFFDFGRESEKEYSFGAPGGPIDYYVMYGPEPKEVVSAYAWLTGPIPLPPMWGLGFQQSRYTYYPEAELMAVANRLRADKIPADALWLDIDFQKNNMPFTVDAERFPGFPEMVKTLAKDQFHLVVITDLHIAKQAGVGYKPYDSGVAGDHFVKNPDGSTFVGPVWPGPAVFPDFTRAQTRKWWGTLYKGFVADGVSGFWNDMNEPAVFETPTKTMPDSIQHRIDEPGFAKRTADHLEIHNVFGMQNTRGTMEGLLALQPNVRPFVMTRASFAGGQRYAVTWTGDNSSTWNHLRTTVPQLINLGLSGFSMAGADVGGFAGSPSPDLLTKWIEYAAFQPIDREHSAKGTRAHEVWIDGPEHEAIRKRYIEERYRLMPYLYTAAEETSRDGIPIMRPLFLEFPHATSDGHPMDLDAGGGEFLFGGRMLIAANPSPEEVAPYEVHLPPGTWFDYWTGERFERATKTQARDLEQRDALLQYKPLMITPKLDTLPVYVRGGSILPISPLTQSTEETPKGPLTLRIYPSSDASAPCEGDVYADDGKSFAFRKGQFARIHFTCKVRTDGTLTVDAGLQQGSFTPWWKEYRLEVYGWTPKDGKAEVSGKVLSLTQSGGVVSVETAADRNGVSLLLR